MKKISKVSKLHLTTLLNIILPCSGTAREKGDERAVVVVVVVVVVVANARQPFPLELLLPVPPLRVSFRRMRTFNSANI